MLKSSKNFLMKNELLSVTTVSDKEIYCQMLTKQSLANCSHLGSQFYKHYYNYLKIIKLRPKQVSSTLFKENTKNQIIF